MKTETLDQIRLNLTSHPELREYVIFDIETTGLSPSMEKIIEIGALKVREGVSGKGVVVDEFSSLINPKRKLKQSTIDLTGITDEMLFHAPEECEVLEKFHRFIDDFPLVAHNVSFDYGFIELNLKNYGKRIENKTIDTLKLSRYILPNLDKHDLGTLAYYLGIENSEHHRAINDTEVLLEILNILLQSLLRRKVSLEEVMQRKR